MTASRHSLPDDPALSQKYRLEALIASGGQAHVWKAVQIGLGRPVAIKILRTQVVDKVFARHASRFEREAKLISQLRDPHTITLYDFGTLKDGSMFMVFEFIDGLTLDAFLAREGRLVPGRVVKLMRQLLSCLQEAHAFGVLHRDIKPQNIIVYEHAGRRDQIKVLDFGIAKILDGSLGKSLTGTGKVVGTPRYMPPDYAEGLDPSPSGDLFSLGLVAYELLTGRHAIQGDNPNAIFTNLLSDEPIVLPADLEIPATLRAIVERLVQRAPAARYQTAEQVLLDLKGWRDRDASDSDDELDFADYGDASGEETETERRATAPLHPVSTPAPAPAPEPLREATTAKIQALAAPALGGDEDPTYRSGPTAPMHAVAAAAAASDARPASKSLEDEAIEIAGGTRPMFLANESSSSEPEPAAPGPAGASEPPARAPDASRDEAPAEPEKKIEEVLFSGSSATGVGSTERFPDMVHRTVEAPKVAPSLGAERRDRVRSQHPAITPSKLERPPELDPNPPQERPETPATVRVDVSASGQFPVDSGQREVMGVPLPIFLFALVLVFCMIAAALIVVAVAVM